MKAQADFLKRPAPAPVAETSRRRPGAPTTLQALADSSPQVQAQARLQAGVDSSPYMLAQRKRLDGLVGAAAQMQPEEEELQGRFAAQMQPEEEELQGRFAAQHKTEAAPQAAPARQQENRTGMPNPVKAKMENAFNTDFSDVKVHADSSRASSVGALAYTQGTAIHFAPGQFRPERAAGQQLLGHELTHVVQQREGRVEPTTEVAGLPVNDDPSLEQEADVMGSKAARG